jgi:hypothetical protein
MKFFMRSGRAYDFTDGAVLQPIILVDILQSLALERRFFNQADWTVLQHSIAAGFVAEKIGANPLLKMHCYVHDFPEAFGRDVPSFFKSDDQRTYEEILFEKICKSIGVPALSQEDHEVLAQIDGHLVVVESHEGFQYPDIFQAVVEQQFVGATPKTQMNVSLLIHCTNAIRDVAGLELTDAAGNITDLTNNIFRNALSRH